MDYKVKKLILFLTSQIKNAQKQHSQEVHHHHHHEDVEWPKEKLACNELPPIEG